MQKIKISSIGNNFIEINYGDFAINFNKSYHIFNKHSVDILMSADKSTLTITWIGSLIIITQDTLEYIDTIALTVEGFYNELKIFI